MLSFLKRLVLLAILIVLAAAGGVVWWAQQPVSLAASPLEVVIKPNSILVAIALISLPHEPFAFVGMQDEIRIARSTGCVNGNEATKSEDCADLSRYGYLKAYHTLAIKKFRCDAPFCAVSYQYL